MDEAIDIAAIFGAEVGFSERFAVYVPNKDRDGNSVEQGPWIERIMTILSELCGGATAMPPVRGAWLNPESKKLVFEEPVLVYAYVNPAKFVSGIKDLANIVREMGVQTNQGQVAFEFGGVLYFIDFPQAQERNHE
jgi:hypothetical protein